ncbi:MAG: NUDIX domain-containing protein [Gammaproteobacteria bacterium]|nr:NUDIX domain-containing protein [Gammaproteobacteria bacterium]NND58727.1 NUDIX domain-containing protein [Gammaproteobacteria bacterium]
MPNLHRRKTRLSCGVIIVRHTDTGIRFLLLRAFSNWDFPKGMLERGETPLAAALREVEEETTLDDLDFAWGQEYVETGPYSRGKVARYYIAITRRDDIDLPVNPELGRAEHAEFRWVDLDQARTLTTARLGPVLDWAQQVINS